MQQTNGSVGNSVRIDLEESSDDDEDEDAERRRARRHVTPLKTAAVGPVDELLANIRLRNVDDALARMRVVISDITVGRATRAVGVIFRLLLNGSVALRSLLRRSLYANSVDTRAVRVLAAAEAIHLLIAVAGVALKLGPVIFGFRASRISLRSSAWRRGAEAGDRLRELASYSILSNIPRIKHVVPGAWSYLNMEAAILNARAGEPVVTWMYGAIAAGLRVFAFTAVELVAFSLGLAGLHQKLGDVRGVTSGWIPFLGFANQITGIVDQEELRMVAVLRLIFAGEDAEFGRHEVEAMREFNGFLARDLCVHHGWWRGIVLYLSLTSDDYQKIVVAEARGSVQRRSRVRSSDGALSRWWLGGRHQHMALGRIILAADQLLGDSNSVAKLRRDHTYAWEE